jgi:hypothetical protein
MILDGRCHCGAVSASFETDRDPDVIQVRACQCSFCRRHGARTVSDPAGHLTLRFAAGSVDRYTFASGSADFLICQGCGIYVATVISDGDGELGVLNIAGTDIEVLTHRAADLMHYEDETAEQKRARRRARWTPVQIIQTEGTVA